MQLGTGIAHAKREKHKRKGTGTTQALVCSGSRCRGWLNRDRQRWACQELRACRIPKAQSSFPIRARRRGDSHSSHSRGEAVLGSLRAGSHPQSYSEQGLATASTLQHSSKHPHTWGGRQETPVPAASAPPWEVPDQPCCFKPSLNADITLGTHMIFLLLFKEVFLFHSDMVEEKL